MEMFVVGGLAGNLPGRVLHMQGLSMLSAFMMLLRNMMLLICKKKHQQHAQSATYIELWISWVERRHGRWCAIC